MRCNIKRTIRSKFIPVPALMFSIFVAAWTLVYAQIQAERVVGTVYDAQHAIVPWATVKIANDATNISHTVITDAEGHYVLTPVEPGTYTVSARKSGFKTCVQSVVEVTVG